MKKLLILTLMFTLLLAGCTAKEEPVTTAATTATNNADAVDPSTVEKMNATITIEGMGDIKLELYPSKAPQTVANFAELARKNFYNGLIFHRVIEGFMIQAGDPFSRDTALINKWGQGGPDYTVPAEFVNEYWHKKGALAAARKGDMANPTKASSGSQFYIVWGKKYTDYELKQMAAQLDGQRGQQIFNGLAAQHRDSIQAMYQRGDNKGLMQLQNRLAAETDKILKETPGFTFTPEQTEAYTKVGGTPFLDNILKSTPGFKFTPEQTRDYTTIGGTPFLDNQYTVFGEVVEGLDVVEKIQKVATGSADRPKEDVIMTMTVLE